MLLADDHTHLGQLLDRGLAVRLAHPSRSSHPYRPCRNADRLGPSRKYSPALAGTMDIVDVVATDVALCGVADNRREVPLLLALMQPRLLKQLPDHNDNRGLCEL